MKAKKDITLVELKAGQSAHIKSIHGGVFITKRLSDLGLRPGKRVTKISGMFMRGPVTVKVGSSNIALGFGMANKVFVEVTE